MTALPFRGAATSTGVHHMDTEQPERMQLPFGNGDSHPPVGDGRSNIEDGNHATSSNDAAQQREPSSFEDGGWRPWVDKRDSTGRTFLEWVQACRAVELDKEPAWPINPRLRGVLPPKPRDEWQPEVAQSPAAPFVATTPTGEVRRLDAYRRRPSKKERARRTVEKGTHWLRRKDADVMETVASHGWMRRDHLAQAVGYATTNGITRRLNALIDAEVLTAQKGMDGYYWYATTLSGRRIIGLDGYQQPKMSMMSFDHRAAEVSVALWLEARHHDAVVITELELRAAGFAWDGTFGPGGVLSPRLLRLAPWLEGQMNGDYSVWTPGIRNAGGGVTGRKRPDLLLAREGKPPVVYEIELTKKAVKEYRQMVEAYDGAARDGHINPVVHYLVSPEASLKPAQCKGLLGKAAKQAQLPAGSPLRITVEAIPESVWRPTVATLRAK